jgi:superfamily I DNA and/or RNA helicase
VIDECAASQEIDTLMAIDEASQVVLIGDHKQLGPIYRGYVLEATESMMIRLI